MTQRGRKATVALVAAAVLMVTGRANANQEQTAAAADWEATIVLHVANYAKLPNGLLNVAMARVGNVYERIGVRVVWVEDVGSVNRRQDGQLHLTVVLLSRDMAERTIKTYGINDGVLGQAHPPSGRASVLCDRIAATSTHLATSLGDVIAHEVGHLLLGWNSHSYGGIMRANMDVRTLQLQSFDDTQARAIRRSLADLH